jgi:hypothetical protein
MQVHNLSKLALYERFRSFYERCTRSRSEKFTKSRSRSRSKYRNPLNNGVAP